MLYRPIERRLCCWESGAKIVKLLDLRLATHRKCWAGFTFLNSHNFKLQLSSGWIEARVTINNNIWRFRESLNSNCFRFIRVKPRYLNSQLIGLRLFNQSASHWISDSWCTVRLCRSDHPGRRSHCSQCSQRQQHSDIFLTAWYCPAQRSRLVCGL